VSEQASATMKDLRARRGTTQADLAARLGMNQGALSRLESRGNLSLNMLRSYVGALGGELRLTAVFPGESITLSGFTDTETRDDLLALVYKQCVLHPMPEDRKADRFLVRRVDDALLELEKISNMQLVEIPIRRVLEILPAPSHGVATIVLRGRLEWSAHRKLWDLALD